MPSGQLFSSAAHLPAMARDPALVADLVMREWGLPPEHGADGGADDGEDEENGTEMPSFYRKPVAAPLHLDWFISHSLPPRGLLRSLLRQQCVTAQFILPHADPTGLWRQLVFRVLCNTTKSRPRPNAKPSGRTLSHRQWAP